MMRRACCHPAWQLWQGRCRTLDQNRLPHSISRNFNEGYRVSAVNTARGRLLCAIRTHSQHQERDNDS